MAENNATGRPKLKYRSYDYYTGLNWLGGRAGMLSSQGKPEFRIASPPEFRGEAGVWSPEDLFVAAVEACTMTTFLALAQRRKLAVVSYKSTAKGTLEFDDGGFRITKITVTPEIVVENQQALTETQRLIAETHSHCLIANSINSAITIEPVITVRPLPG